MKGAFEGLTSRGRALAAAGITAFVLALLFGQTDVMRVGILAASLPLLAALSVARTRFRLSSQRVIEPARVQVGDTAEVTLSIENVAALPTGLLLVEDFVPSSLGLRPRFVIDRLAPRSSRVVRFSVRSDIRGRYLLGPLSVRLTDPFGFCRLDRAFSTQHQLTVTPRVEILPTVTLKGDWSGSGDSRSRSVAAAGEDDVAVRDYRHGDELRRVHWRATAKQGSLMVRREEQPWESRCTLLLDTRVTAHPGHGPDGSFEKAVSMAASAAIHMSRRGYAVRMVTGNGPVVSSTGSEDYAGVDSEGLLLDAMAVVETERQLNVHSLASSIRHATEGLMLAVFGHLSPDDADKLVRARHGMGTSIALVTDVAGWKHHIEPQQITDVKDAIALLRSAGWIVAPISRDRPLTESWSSLAHGAGLPLFSGSALAADQDETAAVVGER